jgi:hypothetical protein
MWSRSYHLTKEASRFIIASAPESRCRRADVTRGRRAPSTSGGQPIRILHDVPVNQRGRMIREADRPGDRELLCLDGITREPDRGVL